MKIYKNALPRFLAYFIDGLIFLPFIYLDYLLTNPETPAIVAIIGLTISYTICHYYSIIFHTYFGQTVGKMLMKVLVLDISGNSISLRQAFIRELPMIILSFGFLSSEIYQMLTIGINETLRDSFFYWTVFWGLWIWLIAEIIVMFSNQKGRAIHDYIAGTVVIKTSIDKELLLQ